MLKINSAQQYGGSYRVSYRRQDTCMLRLLLLCQFVCDGFKFCQSTSLLHQRSKKENHARASLICPSFAIVRKVVAYFSIKALPERSSETYSFRTDCTSRQLALIMVNFPSTRYIQLDSCSSRGLNSS